MADSVEEFKLHYLFECLNGTDNPTNIPGRSYYIQDFHGLSFFDRLENKTNKTSTSVQGNRISTFILGDPLQEENGRADISRLDHEYFSKVIGTLIEKKKGMILDKLESRIVVVLQTVTYFTFQPTIKHIWG